MNHWFLDPLVAAALAVCALVIVGYMQSSRTSEEEITTVTFRFRIFALTLGFLSLAFGMQQDSLSPHTTWGLAWIGGASWLVVWVIAILISIGTGRYFKRKLG